MTDFKPIIERMAELSRIKLPEGELERYSKKAESILSYVKKLEEIDISDVEATSHAVESSGKLREDKVIPSDFAKELLELAPERDGDYVQVPKVIES